MPANPFSKRPADPSGVQAFIDKITGELLHEHPELDEALLIVREEVLASLDLTLYNPVPPVDLHGTHNQKSHGRRGKGKASKPDPTIARSLNREFARAWHKKELTEYEKKIAEVREAAERYEQRRAKRSMLLSAMLVKLGLRRTKKRAPGADLKPVARPSVVWARPSLTETIDLHGTHNQKTHGRRGQVSSGAAVREKTPKAILDFEESIRKSPVEVSQVFDVSGKSYGGETGDETSVDFDLPYGVVEENFILTHNHPGKGTPFSQQDIYTFIHSGMGELRAVGAENTYSLKWKPEKRPEPGREYGMFFKPDRMDEYELASQLWSEKKATLVKGMRGRTPSVEEEIDLRSEMLEEIADEVGMIFTRTRRGE